MTKVSSDAIESLQQLTGGWRTLVQDRGGDVREVPGMAVRWADSAFPFWNCLTLTDHGAGPALLEERLGQAVALMRAKKQPGFLWLFEDMLDAQAREGLADAIERAGLVLSLSGIGMAGDVLPLAPTVHADLRFVRVANEAQLLAFADINARAYGMPLEAARAGLGGSAMWKSDVHAYLALANDVPVATAASIIVDECVFVIMVATEPGHERKGYGEAVTRQAMCAGGQSSGLTRATLHATMAGAPVYARIGLHQTSTISFYGLKE